jgi:hypothetical protein
MPKNRGIVSCCRPGVECLEERALLSGGSTGAPGTGETVAPPSPPPFSFLSSSSPLPGSGGAPAPQNGSPQRPDEPSTSQLSQTAPQQPGDDTASQPPVVTSDQGDTGGVSGDMEVMVTTITSSVGSSPASGPVAASFVVVFEFLPKEAQPEPAGPASLDAQSVTTEPEISGPVLPDAQATSAAGMTVSEGREAVQEPVGISNVPSGRAVTSPPAQLLSFSDADSVSARLVSEGETSAGGSRLAADGAVRGSVTVAGRPGAAITSRGGLISTNDASTGVIDTGTDEWPRPRSADLIASALPYDRAALDRAIDRFFQQFEDLKPGDLVGRRPAHIVLYALALTSTFAALDVVRRRWRLTTTDKHLRLRQPLMIADHIGFPELPASWSSRLS